jgi:hypothetical protein
METTIPYPDFSSSQDHTLYMETPKLFLRVDKKRIGEHYAYYISDSKDIPLLDSQFVVVEEMFKEFVEPIYYFLFDPEKEGESYLAPLGDLYLYRLRTASLTARIRKLLRELSEDKKI